MTAHIADFVLDDGLASLKSAARYVYICSQEPTNFTETSSTYASGSKQNPSCLAVASAVMPTP